MIHASASQSSHSSRSRSHKYRRIGRVIAAIGLGLIVVACAWASSSETASGLSFEHLTGNSLTPSQITWQPSGAAVSFLWDEGDGTTLWSMNAMTGVIDKVMRPGGPGDGPADFGIDAYQWFPDSSTLLIEHEGDLYRRTSDGGITRLTETESDEEDATLSADGSKLAYTRDGDLYVFDLDRPAARGERAMTEDGDGETIFNGTTDWVYWEEIWGRDSTGFWWSPDGSKIAYYRFEDHSVGQYPLVDDSGTYPTVRLQRYPKAGTVNPTVRLGVLDVASGETTWLSTNRVAEDGQIEETYLARLHWLPGGDKVAVERLNREQNRLELLFCNPGDGRCDAVTMDEAETWVNLGNDTTFLDDGRFIWASERDGWRHLYLYGADGKLERQLTSGEWSVTSVAHVDRNGPWVVFTRHGKGPLGAAERQVSAVSLAADSGSGSSGSGNRMRDLTSGPGWHSAIVSPTANHWIHRWSDAATPDVLALRPAFGEVIAQLPGNEPPYSLDTLPRWQLMSIKAGDDAGESSGADLPAQLLLPNDFDPERKYPVIMYHYGGPASQVVADRWGTRGRSLWHKMMVERGYVVLKVDNVASAYFGKFGADRSHRRFGARNLEAQLAAVDWLKRQSWVDAERIGLWGWSGGGSNTLYALLNAPGVWAAGMSGAPVTEWTLYDTIWTERYLDHPDDNPDGYRDSSATTYAENLIDPLLIVHGTGDDNVHPQNTMVFVDKLIEAGIPFEQAIYPDQKHGFRGAASKHFYERMTEFFDRHLMPDGDEGTP